MGLQAITLVLFTLCFFEALTLECYSCSTSDPFGTCTQTANCSSNFNCGSTVAYDTTGILNIGTNKFCTNSACVDWSVNFGWLRMTSKCCSSDRCNNVTDSPNGMTCPGCSNSTCLGIATLKCKGDEDQCINLTVQVQGSKLSPSGCASKTYCKDPAKYKTNTAVSITILDSTCSPANGGNLTSSPANSGNSTCSPGNSGNSTCSSGNRGQSLTQGAVLLLLPLLYQHFFFFPSEICLWVFQWF